MLTNHELFNFCRSVDLYLPPSMLLYCYAENEAYGHRTQCTNTQVTSCDLPGFLFGSGYSLSLWRLPQVYIDPGAEDIARSKESFIGSSGRLSPRVADTYGSFIDLIMWRDADIQVRV
jgi:hypothetical protein